MGGRLVGTLLGMRTQSVSCGLPGSFVLTHLSVVWRCFPVLLSPWRARAPLAWSFMLCFTPQGKTLQTISLLGFLRQYKNITGPHLVIVPKSTLGNWMNEFGRWCPDIRPVRFHGDQEARRHQMEEELVFGRFDVCVTSYEMVTKEKTFLSKFAWRYLVIDEAHRIKNEASLLSQVVRLFETQARLLVTGTPLQNNLKELWALLNFLLPDVFSSSDDFESWFSVVEETDGGAAGAIAPAATGGGDGDDGDAVVGAAEAAEKAKAKTEIVSQLHAVLRPFLIRRHKTEVETSLPPKTETVLFTWLTPMQLDLYRNLLRKDVTAINGKGGDRVRLLNLVMQLRKVCQHPYLFEGQEDRSLDPYGDHLITNCAKLSLLDKLLPRLRADGHRVLIFSQMTRVLDMLEDYCHENLRDYPYCRIDGGTDGESRDEQIAEFNRPGSEKFIFLLSTRAGGLGINLATADTVIIFDSDWNPQMDLQAMDRAHRIGQKKPVTVLRLVTRDSVEERILRKAMEKLRLDSLVIQQGRLATTKNVNKDELLDMVRCGADKFFSAKAGEFEDEDLDAILARGQRKTKELNDDLSARAAAAAETGNLSLLDLTLDGRTAPGGTGSVYNFQGENFAPGAAGGGGGAAGDHFFLDVGKRSRVRTYDENALAGVGVNGGMSAAEVAASRARAKFKTLKYKVPKLDDHQLFNTARLKELFAAERAIVDAYNERVEASANEAADAATAAVSAGLDPPPLPTPPRRPVNRCSRLRRRRRNSSWFVPALPTGPVASSTASSAAVNATAGRPSRRLPQKWAAPRPPPTCSYTRPSFGAAGRPRSIRGRGLRSRSRRGRPSWSAAAGWTWRSPIRWPPTRTRGQTWR